MEIDVFIPVDNSVIDPWKDQIRFIASYTLSENEGRKARFVLIAAIEVNSSGEICDNAA